MKFLLADFWFQFSHPSEGGSCLSWLCGIISCVDVLMLVVRSLKNLRAVLYI